MGMLAEQLRAIIEGPLGTDGVTETTVSERVGAIRQHERRHVFGTVVYRDGSDGFFVNDNSKPLTRREVVEAVKDDLEAHGRLLDEKLAFGAMMAMGDQQKAVDAAEKKIGEAFKKIARRYVQALNKMTGAKWNVVSASESIFSLDSDESPKRAVDIYWEYDPGSETASIYIEGPKGKQKVYTKQKLSDIPKRNYIDWLGGVLKEDMEEILFMAFDDEALLEDVLTEKKFSDLVGKKSWATLLPAVMSDEGLQKELFDLIQTAYKPIGGHLKIKKPSDIKKEIFFANAIDVDKDPEADAVVFGKIRAGRQKLTGMGHDGSSAGKQQAMKKWGEQLKAGKAFAEVSGAIAHITLNKLGANSIGGEEVVKKMLPGKSIEWVGKHPSGKFPGNDNWYRRKIGGKSELKIMVGKGAPGEMEKMPKKPKKEDVEMSQNSLLEEIWSVVDEAAMVSYRRGVARNRPMHIGSTKKPKVVASGTKVSKLFKQLVMALTRGGDWDAAIKALRKENVPEAQINYAIKFKEVPYAYAEGIEDESDDWVMAEGSIEEAAELKVTAAPSGKKLDDKEIAEGASIAMTAVMRQMGLPIWDKHEIRKGFYNTLKKVYGN
jgi:hypothetical protein